MPFVLLRSGMFWRSGRSEDKSHSLRDKISDSMKIHQRKTIPTYKHCQTGKPQESVKIDERWWENQELNIESTTGRNFCKLLSKDEARCQKSHMGMHMLWMRFLKAWCEARARKVKFWLPCGIRKQARSGKSNCQVLCYCTGCPAYKVRICKSMLRMWLLESKESVANVRILRERMMKSKNKTDVSQWCKVQE